MRNGQNKRMRGRNNHNHHHRKNHNPMSRGYESNGPDVKIRGNPAHIAEKYIQLARDAHTSGDPISAENYYQHAEHYYRLIAAAQEQFRQNNPQFARPEQDSSGARDDAFDDGDDDMGQPIGLQNETPFGTGEPQPYVPRDVQPFPQQQNYAPRPQQQSGANQGDIDRLPSFITGAQPQQHQPQSHQQNPQGGQGFQGNPQHHQNYGTNGHDNQGDRFPLHRRRRRHRGGSGGGPRHDMQGGPQFQGGDGGED